jgi:diaminohydroxyphosphoribosylaminopyrimidine deaminase/5-amino-6-(5-phosphoribosylamino)uracil reductase
VIELSDFSLQDSRFMKLAIELGKRGTGYTEPNPTVGAVVVKNSKILSAGFHRRYGEEHAEAMALKNTIPRNTTLYVPLEPCCHFGKTPPCTDRIIEKKVIRVVIAIQDPNPLVNGRGIRQLRQNQIRVEVGCLAPLYRQVNRHYFTFITRKRPHVTIKAGISLDGKLTDKHGRSRWMTDKKMRAFSRSLRGEFSAILVGDNTVMEDDPRLTIRDREWGNKKLVRVVLDTENRVDMNKRIFKHQPDSPLFIFSSDAVKNQTPKVINHYFVPSDGNRLRLDRVLEILAQQQIASLLVEGGGQVIDSFLKQGLVDELVLFTASKLVGGQGAVELFSSGKGIGRPIRFRDQKIMEFGSGFIFRGCLDSEKRR